MDNNKINKSQCATLLGITKQRISQLVKEGKLIFGSDGKISPDEAKAQFNKTKERTTSNSFDAHEEESLTFYKTRTEKFRSMLEEIEYKKANGELLDVNDVKQNAFKIGKKLHDSLLSIPERISPNLAVETNPAEIRKILIKEIRETLAQIADDLQGV
jgi:phage terminase Nu1 subunit (DNA packaging protein)